ncbi:MAG: hypothetical protein ACFFAO_03515 [Candidatus Hermodarchaeota archaeon]
MQEGGVCIYHRFFSDEFKDLQVDLVTPFISAIMTFSEKVISKKLEVLEMGELRFVIRKDKDFLFVMLSDSSENLLFINSRLEKIVKVFFRAYDVLVLKGKINEKLCMIESKKFDNLIDSFIHGVLEINQIKKHPNYNKIVEHFSDLISQHEIIGSALLTDKGTIIYSSLTGDLLIRAMKELEIRYMSGTFDLPELFYTLGNGQKVCERIIPYNKFMNLLVVVQFTKETTLGMMDYTSEMIIEKIEKLLL